MTPFYTFVFGVVFGFIMGYLARSQKDKFR